MTRLVDAVLTMAVLVLTRCGASTTTASSVGVSGLPTVDLADLPPEA